METEVIVSGGPSHRSRVVAGLVLTVALFLLQAMLERPVANWLTKRGL
jgi:hypothetical protein